MAVLNQVSCLTNTYDISASGSVNSNEYGAAILHSEAVVITYYLVVVDLAVQTPLEAESSTYKAVQCPTSARARGPYQ